MSNSTTVTTTVHSRSDELDVFYFVGSSISLAASLFVIFSYLKFPACRKHPSSLIFWRSFFDVIFSLQFIILFSNSSIRDKCDPFSFLFQFSILGSQSWYFTTAIDLFRAMRNPFTDPSANLPMYHLYVWVSSVASAVAIVAGGQAGYRDGLQICWTKVSNGSGGVNYLNWITFYIPTFIYYSCSIIVTIYAVRRLRSGLEETFTVRLKVLQNGVRYVAGFTVYWTLAFIIYLLVWINERDGQANPDNHLPLYAAFAVTIAVRALVDVPIWIYNQDVITVYKRWWNKTATPAVKDENADVDINRALRKEVLMFTTLGISNSIDNVSLMTPLPLESDPGTQYFPINLDPKDPSNRESISTFMVNRSDVLKTTTTTILATSLVGATTATPTTPHHHDPSCNTTSSFTNLSTTTTASSQSTDKSTSTSIPSSPHHHHHSSNSNEALQIPFVDYAPQVFHYIRRKFNIDDTDYKRSIKGNTEQMIEKFTEGRSGSFFYFSEDGKYIVKTLTTGESKFLIHFLPHYIKYMSTHPHSLISRFIGFHSMTMYNLTIYFIVMQSVFLTPRKIHERYDLKGSWVDRNAGKTGRSASSSSSVNGKKKQGNPNKGIVLKDSDLNRTIRIAPSDRDRFTHQVKCDSEFLRDCNIMDYSLLLGIHHTRHFVRPINHLAAIAMRREYIPLTGESETLSRSAAGTVLNTNPNNKSSPVTVPSPPQSPTAGAGTLAIGTPNGTGYGFGGFSNTPTSSMAMADANQMQAMNTSASSLSVMNSYPYSTASIESFQRDDGGLQAAIIEGPGIYFFGIIDILQEYNSGKKLERFFKVYFRLKDPDGISALPPDPYSKRFVKAMIDMVTDDDEEEKIKEEAEKNEEKERNPHHQSPSKDSDADNHKSAFGRTSSSPLPSTSAPNSHSHAFNLNGHANNGTSTHTGVGLSSRASAPHNPTAYNTNTTSPRATSTSTTTRNSTIVTNEPFRPNPLLAMSTTSETSNNTATNTSATTTTTSSMTSSDAATTTTTPARGPSSSIEGPRGKVFAGQIQGPIAGRNANEVEPVPYDLFTRPSISNDTPPTNTNTASTAPPPPPPAPASPPPPPPPASHFTTTVSSPSRSDSLAANNSTGFYGSSIVESSSTLSSSTAASLPVASHGHLTQSSPSVASTSASASASSSSSTLDGSSTHRDNKPMIHSFSVTDSAHETKSAVAMSNNGWSSV